MVGDPASSIGMFNRYGAAATITFYNNIISRSTVGGRGDVDISASAAALWDYNCYPASPQLGLSTDNTTDYPGTLYTTLSAWAAALPSGCTGKDSHSALGSPGFAGGAGSKPANYKLAVGSICRGAGSSTGIVGGSAVDMGAWGGTDVNTGLAIAQIGCAFGESI
jgi:hypothetical protein